MSNQNRVNGTQPKFAECCEEDIVLLNIMSIYWTTSGTSLNKAPRDYMYVVASNILSKWSVTSVYMYTFQRPLNLPTVQGTKITKLA